MKICKHPQDEQELRALPMSLLSRSPVIETFSLVDSTLERAGDGVPLQNLKGALSCYSGIYALFPLSLLHSCLPKLEQWKAAV